MSSDTYILTKPICEMSFDDGVDIRVADIGPCGSHLVRENSITFYESY